MKILLMKDVFKLGRAGDVKKVADGYGRNYLFPQGLAVLATPGAIKQAGRIRAKAAERREALNSELSGLAEEIRGLRIPFAAKAGESEKLYGSITAQQVADAITEATTFTIKRQQLKMQPIRTLGNHSVAVRLTIDLVPELTVVVYREGEAMPKEGEEAAKTEESTTEEVIAEEIITEETITEEVVTEEIVTEEAPEAAEVEETDDEEIVAEEAETEETEE